MGRVHNYTQLHMYIPPEGREQTDLLLYLKHVRAPSDHVIQCIHGVRSPATVDPCKADKQDYTVAIAVGIVLLILIIIVILAYACSRRRRSDGYQSL